MNSLSPKVQTLPSETITYVEHEIEFFGYVTKQGYFEAPPVILDNTGFSANIYGTFKVESDAL